MEQEIKVIVDEGTIKRNALRMNNLVEKAKRFVGCSESYIQSRLWASRDQHTSIKDIDKAVKVALNS